MTPASVSYDSFQTMAMNAAEFRSRSSPVLVGHVSEHIARSLRKRRCLKSAWNERRVRNTVATWTARVENSIEITGSQKSTYVSLDVGGRREHARKMNLLDVLVPTLKVGKCQEKRISGLKEVLIAVKNNIYALSYLQNDIGDRSRRENAVCTNYEGEGGLKTRHSAVSTED